MVLFDISKKYFRIDQDVLGRTARYISFRDMQYWYPCFLLSINGIVTEFNFIKRII